MSHLKDYIAGKREIRQYNAESPFMEKYDSIAKEDGEKQKKINIIKDIARSFDTVFFYFIVFINYTICAYGIYKGHLYVGDMVFLTQLASGITEYISQISQYKIMMNSVKLDESLPAKQIKSDTIIADNLKEIQTIELNGVTVTYGDKCILDNISYTFEKNHSYMIIGKSGSGKSTFLQLLLKINEDYLGDIYFNDVNLKHVNKKDLYENIGYVPQDTFIFNKTVEENITFEKSRSINDLLEKLNIEHLETAILSQNGENISQGERKRIDIARNLWNTPDVLLSDEATASLDLKNKLDITKRLTENKNFILISVSHDYTDEMIQMYDHIIELNSGKLMEVDKNEIYKKA